MRRSVAILIAFGGALLAVGACSAFSGSDAPAQPEAGPSGDEGGTSDAPVTNDGGVADAPATQTDAGPPVCGTFDASAFDPPDGDVTNYTCDGVGGKNLAGDPKNCGWCGHACLGTAGCTSGICGIDDAVVGTPNRGSNFTVDQALADGIYWHTQTPGTLFVSALDEQDAAAARTLSMVDASEPNSTDVYTLTRADRTYVRTFGNMYVAPLDGGDLTLLYQGTVVPVAAAAAGNLLIETFGDTRFFTYDKFDGSSPYSSTGTYQGVRDVAATPNGKYVFFLARSEVDAGVLPDGGGPHVGRGTLQRFTLASHDLDRLTTMDTLLNEDNWMLTADDTSAYFADSAGGIWSIPVDAPPNSTATLLRPPNGDNVLTITIADDVIYWFASSATTTPYQGLYAMSKCGGSVRTYIPAGYNQANPNYSPANIVTDATYIYWSSAGGPIRRIAK